MQMDDGRTGEVNWRDYVNASTNIQFVFWINKHFTSPYPGSV